MAAKRACDQCKLRKIKCSPSRPCEMCFLRNFECTYLKPQKRRGPRGKRLSQILEQQQQQKQPRPQAQKEGVAQDDIERLTPSQPGTRSGSSDFGAYPSPLPSRQSVSIPASSLEEERRIDPPCELDLPTTSLDGGVMSMIDSDYHDTEYWPPDRGSTNLPLLGSDGTYLFVNSALPLVVENDSHGTGAPIPDPSPLELQPPIPMYNFLTSQDDFEARINIWPSNISEVSLIPWIDVFFDRLYPTIPVLSRSALFTRFFLQEHHHNPMFGSMLLSLCAFAITQPIFINERSTSSTRASQAKTLMEEATKMRSSADFGENPDLEAVLTSFFFFGCLFGSNQHNAAWLRLREAIDLAVTMRLNQPDSYRLLSDEERCQHVIVCLVLSITERAYAIQHRHPINFRLSARSGDPLSDAHITSSTRHLLSGMAIYDEKDVSALMGLSVLMEIFAVIDDQDIDCWNGSCGAIHGTCRKHDASKVLSLHDKIKRVDCQFQHQQYDRLDLDDASDARQNGNNIPTGLKSHHLITQYADILVTQKWLQNRLWLLCLTHNLLKAEYYRPELLFTYAVSLAESTLDICRSLPLSSMEAHGVGLIEKLYDIGTMATTVLYKPDASGDTRLASDITTHVNLAQQPDSAATLPSSQNLGDKYLKIFSTLRGGNHPYLEKYKAHFRSMAAT